VRALYRTTFQEVIPEIAARLSPDVGYIHSSPSAGDELGAADMLDYFDKGDSHYYHHANSDAPYRKLGRYRIRFLSEFGFQSYPSLKTLREYLPEEALTPYSPDMLTHQKSVRGNETIELYLSRDFFVPGDFADYVYMSQMMAGEILRYTVEHMRRGGLPGPLEGPAVLHQALFRPGACKRPGGGGRGRDRPCQRPHRAGAGGLELGPL